MSQPVVLPEGQIAFRLNEVCKLASVQPYMLRFWGTEFPALEAQKSGTGQRLYSREQVELILEIRQLLFDEGLTISGARKRIGPRAEAKLELVAEEAEKPAKPAVKTSSARRKKGAKKTAEVDKGEPEHVQRLLSTLRDVRDEIGAIMSELDPS
jgi:DNA-binding transcriptional MerR regulator